MRFPPASCAVVGLAVEVLVVCVFRCVVFVLWCVVCCVCSILVTMEGSFSSNCSLRHAAPRERDASESGMPLTTANVAGGFVHVG